MATETDESVTITISGIPQSLVDDVDELAAAQDRSRSSWLRLEIEQAVARARKSNAGQKEIRT